MARTARIVLEDFPHHIVQRGNRNQPVFFRPEDRVEYLQLLQRYSRQSAIEIWAYCLMDTHIHLIAVPRPGGRLAQALAETHKRYARMINFRHGWRGYLWQGRFSSDIMEEPYLYAAMRDIERNPVAAGIVHRAEDYEWSSAKSHVLRQPHPILSPCVLEERIAEWAEFLRVSELEAPVERHLTTGRP